MLWLIVKSEVDCAKSLPVLYPTLVYVPSSSQTIAGTIGSDNDQSGSGELWLFNPSSTTFVKHFMNRASHAQHGNSSLDWFSAGYLNTTSAVDAIQFKQSSGNIDAGTIKLYGIKDS